MKRTLLFAASAALVVGNANASPIGDTYTFAFSGFLETTADGFVNQDGELGEEGGVQGEFVFGTPSSFDFFGNSLVLDSSVTATSPSEEMWTLSITAEDGGLLWDPANPDGLNFFGFRVLGFGASGDTGGASVNPIFSPTQDTPLDVWTLAENAIEIYDANGLISTRNIFHRTEANGTRLHIGFSNASTSEIRVHDTLFGGQIGDVTEIRVNYTTGVIPEPTSALLLASVLGIASLRCRTLLG